MAYVDGFIIPLPKDKIEEYKRQAQLGEQVWREHGAIGYVECLGDDVPYGELTSFPRAVQAKEDEIVVFSYVIYESREHRDQVLAKVMADPRMKSEDMPFDGKRMIYGRFKPFLGL